jgi:hypothetical protein
VNDAWPAIPRFFVGGASLFYGVEHLRDPEYVALSSATKAHSRMDSRPILLTYFVDVILILAGGVLTGESEGRWGGLIDILLLAICAVASVRTSVDLLECADLVSALVFGDVSPPSRR